MSNFESAEENQEKGETSYPSLLLLSSLQFTINLLRQEIIQLLLRADSELKAVSIVKANHYGAGVRQLPEWPMNAGR